jgi:hypothetical protein
MDTILLRMKKMTLRLYSCLRNPTDRQANFIVVIRNLSELNMFLLHRILIMGFITLKIQIRPAGDRPLIRIAKFVEKIPFQSVCEKRNTSMRT